jgi:hypothetical protein
MATRATAEGLSATVDATDPPHEGGLSFAGVRPR